MALRLELHDRVDTHTCPMCGGQYPRVFGTVHDGDRRAGVYSADLHQHGDDRRALLSLGVMCWNGEREEWEKCAVTIEVWSTATEFPMAFRDSSRSPYKDNGLLGRVLEPSEARASQMRDEFFHIADHVVDHDRRVNGHLNA